MFKKFNQKFKAFATGKSGFSLVELIVVIAIMAVMAAVLAPALLGYVERSRAQKDSSAFDEVVNSVQLSLADQDVYDEMLMYSAEQYSCYVDSDTPDEANKVDIKAGKYYMYNDNERQLDETVYKLDGVMRGVTITFAPDAAASNSATLDLVKGHVNKYLPSGKKTYGGLTGANASPQLSAITDSELYNALRATIGDKISISSQTYRNSEYTVFISMGTTGGQEAAAQDAIKVWGQFSGTNLPEGSSVAGNTATGSNEFKEPSSNSQPVVPELIHQDIIPAGGIYVKNIGGYYSCQDCMNKNTDARCMCNATYFREGEAFPAVSNGDIYVYGDYVYMYNGEYDCGGCPYVLLIDDFCIVGMHNVCSPWYEYDGWGVGLVERNKSSYGPILESINGGDVKSLSYLFNDEILSAPPAIPSGVVDMRYTFCNSNITTLPDMSSIRSIYDMRGAFYGCNGLTTSNVKIPDYIDVDPNALWSIFEGLFDRCQNLTGVIQMPCTAKLRLPSEWHQFDACPATVKFYHSSSCNGSCGVN